MNFQALQRISGICLCFLPLFGYAQGSVQAVLNVEEIEDKISVSSWCHNGTGESKSLAYQMLFTKRDARGNQSTSKQGGSFKLEPGADTQLSSSTMNLGKKAEVFIKLEILEEGKVLSVDSFPKPKKPTVVPPTPTKDLEGGGNGFIRPEDNPDPRQLKGVEFGGFVFDETKTVWGQQFFQLFEQQWQQLNVVGDYTITIEEVPFRGRTTIVKVKLNEDEIFVRTLQAKYDYLEELSNFAVQVSAARVQQMNQVQQDIQGEDISGSGIY